MSSASPLPTPRSAGRLSSTVYEAVRDRLIAGELPANSRLSVEGLRVEFGISKQPIMEALRRLSADGLVEIIPQVGCVVTSYSLQDVADFYDMFAGFEGAIAAAAASRRSDTQLVALRAVHTQVGTLRDEPDPRRRSTSYRLLNRDFHAAIHAMSGSRIMADTSSRMWDLSDFLINTSGAPQPLSTATSARHHDHDLILDAIEKGDARLARLQMERHILTTIDVIHTEVADEAD